MRPLEGIRIVDLGPGVAAWTATLMLAEAGADVIAVHGKDAPSPDDPGFGALHAGKKCLALDIAEPSAAARLGPLIDAADVVVCAHRPRDLEGTGLDGESLRARNDRLIYCALTCWGQDGPQANVAAHDLNVMAETGLLAQSLPPGREPVMPPVGVAAIGGGAYPAVINILLALRQREQSGKGCVLDVAMADSMFAFQFAEIGNASRTGVWPAAGKDAKSGGSPRYRLYPTADSGYVAVAAVEPRYWENLCERLELDDELRDDGRDPAATAEALAAIFRSRNTKFWRDKFDNRDLGCSTVASLEQALAHPHFKERGVLAGRVAAGEGSMPAMAMAIADGFRDPEIERAAADRGAAVEALLAKQ